MLKIGSRARSFTRHPVSRMPIAYCNDYDYNFSEYRINQTLAIADLTPPRPGRRLVILRNHTRKIVLILRSPQIAVLFNSRLHNRSRFSLPDLERPPPRSQFTLTRSNIHFQSLNHTEDLFGNPSNDGNFTPWREERNSPDGC